MSLSRRRFTQEFKLSAVERLEQGTSAAEVSRAYEVNPNLLHRKLAIGLRVFESRAIYKK